ncbi:MAG: Mammalian cell entry related domain protein [Pedosphaera sp.]|nr:Mammalian cell entry related domain protein [Pedosphaera sp.]
MALQDLTPQLRTRLSRMERAVGWFVLLATLLLLFGFGYYIYTTARSKGWFLTKAPYYTYTDRATGLKEGDPVMMMGFTVGQITKIDAQPPDDFVHSVYIRFDIKEPYYGYLWTEGSRAKVTSAALDLLGKRVVEVTKGTNGYPTYIFNPLRIMSIGEVERLGELPKWRLAQEVYDASGTNLISKAWQPLSKELLQKIATLGNANLRVADTRETRKKMTAVWYDKEGYYEFFWKTNMYELIPDESPALTDRMERLVSSVEAALPNILRLTNQLSAVLSNSANLTSNLNVVAESARPVFTNLASITSQLHGQGTLGDWLIPTNIHQQLETTLTNVNTTVSDADSNIVVLAESLTKSLNSLADITSNLNNQVQVNTNILTRISDTIVHSDQFVQGLKHHWLLRSAFKTKKTNAPPATIRKPLLSPKAKAGKSP